MNIDQTHVKMTIETIENMADLMERSARELRTQAASLKDDNDLTRAAEVANTISNLFCNLRLDLLVRRPLRAVGMK